jgi:hypothetical protein
MKTNEPKTECRSKAFCDNLTVREVPAGTAVGTPFTSSDGDRIGFYVVPDSGLLRIAR